MENSQTVHIDDVSAFGMKAIVNDLYENIDGFESHSAPVCKILLLDGRVAELQITIQADPSEFFND